MSFPEDFIQPEEYLPPQEPIRLPPARRRRARRALVAPGDDERSAMLADLARRAFPSIEFFLFSLLCGAILGAGFLIDSPALLLVGILLAPLMTPWVGLALATVTGSWRFFLQTLAGLLIGGVLIFVTGTLGGLAARLWMPLPLFLANLHSHLWWPNLFVLALGAVLLIISFVRSEEKPILPSVMLTYELYLPLSAAGFGLGVGAPHIWPDGALVFLVHLGLALLIGVITLSILRFHPLKPIGYALLVIIALLSLTVVVVLTGLGEFVVNRFTAFSPTPIVTPIPLPSVTPTVFQITTSETATPALSPPGSTGTPTVNILPSATPSITPTRQATPVYAYINSPDGGGALVRSEPGFDKAVIQSLINSSLVEVLDTQQVTGTVWVHVRTANGLEGWVVQSLLATATPAPNWQPTATSQ